MPTDPEHIDFVVSELRSCHTTLFPSWTKHVGTEVSTYSLAADLITELAGLVAIYGGAIHDALDELSGGKGGDAEYLLARTVGREIL